MKETLLKEISPKTLDDLMIALTDAISQMKDVEQIQECRFKDEVYTMCLCLQGEVLSTIRELEMKKQ